MKVTSTIINDGKNITGFEVLNIKHLGCQQLF